MNLASERGLLTRSGRCGKRLAEVGARDGGPNRLRLTEPRSGPPGGRARLSAVERPTDCGRNSELAADQARTTLVYPMSEVTRILDRVEQGDPHAAAELLPLVYEELRKLAAARLAHEPPGQTLQATALVHEVWLRLTGSTEVQWNGRGHFFGAAAQAMRRILVDRARKRAQQRHGGQLERVDLDNVTVATDDSDDTVLAVHEALEKLAIGSAQEAEIVRLRYFAGLDHAEIAEALGVSEATVRRHWAYARSWLYAELKSAGTQ